MPGASVGDWSDHHRRLKNPTKPLLSGSTNLLENTGARYNDTPILRGSITCKNHYIDDRSLNELIFEKRVLISTLVAPYATTALAISPAR